MYTDIPLQDLEPMSVFCIKMSRNLEEAKRKCIPWLARWLAGWLAHSRESLSSYCVVPGGKQHKTHNQNERVVHLSFRCVYYLGPI